MASYLLEGHRARWLRHSRGSRTDVATAGRSRGWLTSARASLSVVVLACFIAKAVAHDSEEPSAPGPSPTISLTGNRILSAIQGVAVAAGVLTGWELLRRRRQCLAARHIAELEESEERLKLALHASQVGVWEWDLASDRVYWSDECRRIFAMPAAPSTAEEFFRCVHPEDLPALQHRAQQALEGTSSFEAAFRMQGSDGRIRWLADFGIAKRNSAGQPIRLLGTIKDITEDRRTSEVLRESEEKFRQLAENIQQVFWMTSPSKDRMDYVSPAFETIWGCPVKDLYAQPWLWLESIHPEDRPRVQRAAATHQVTGDYDEQYRIVRPDGQERWIQDRAFPVCNADGQVVRVAGIAKDVTDRKREEQQMAALVRELATMKTALDEHAIVAITNPAGRIQYVNDLFCAVSKYSREELLGQDHRIVNSGHHSKAFIRDLWTTISAGRVWKGEIRNRAKDGSFYWVDTTIVPMLNDEGHPCQYVAIRADITARKQSEAALRDLNADLEQRVLERTAQLAQALDREKELGVLKSRFISMASHEFRTPLTAIQASSDLLKHYGERMTAAQRVERLDKIQAEVRNMTALLEDVLFVGRSGAGRVPFAPEPIDLSSACQELCLEMGAALQSKEDIEFTTNRARVLVPTDMKLLRHIVTNLLSNAVKYSRGTEPVQMHLQFETDRVIMTVRDHGIGIPADDLPRLFESFHRAANVHDIPGTGLGLAIVKHSAELHGGQVSVRSEIGRGSEFTVTFPLPAAKHP